MPRKTPGPPCQVCQSPSIAKGLCERHYRRLKKHGSVESTLRPADWGERHKHPLWHSWKWTKRSGRVKRWDDFWMFVEDVGGKRQAEKSLLRRFDLAMPFGPENFFWSEPVSTEADRKTLDGRAAYMREWNKKNPIRAKHYKLKKNFGIGISEYDAMLASQNGGCAVCGQKDEWFNLAVDHCHTGGYVRGLLCSQCNRGLGLFSDDAARLRAAADYLEKTNRLI